MWYKLTAKVQIGSYLFHYVNDIEVSSSWEQLTDTCKITLPRRIGDSYKNISQLIKRGDVVKVSVGYDNNNISIFEGYVLNVGAKTPLEITCEDAMFLLKKGEIRKTYHTATTERIVKDIIGDKVKYKVVANATLGNFRIDNATPAQVLEYLRSRYFIKSWFRQGTLYVGLAYNAALQREHRFAFFDNIIEDSLEFRSKDDIKIALKGIIVTPDNKRIEVPAGDKDGEQRTFFYYNKDKAFVKNQLEKELERLRYDGFKGNFTTIGTPEVRHGDIILLSDKRYPERTGKYLVKKVVTRYSHSTGLRQVIELESKWS